MNKNQNLKQNRRLSLNQNSNQNNNPNLIYNKNLIPIPNPNPNLMPQINMNTSTSQKFSSPLSPINYNSSMNNFVQLDCTNIENKIASDIIVKQNLEKFEKMNKFEMLTSLNKEIENYSKGLPQLMEKVESTIEKINKVNIFDEKTHPIIQMASKHSGHLIHLHIEEISDALIDDLLYECVQELQQIEEIQNKQNQKENFKSFVKDYYQNFSLIKNIETEISKKLTNKSYLTYDQVKTAKENEEFRRRENMIQINQQTEAVDAYKIKTPNPNIYTNKDIYSAYAKKMYSAKLHRNLITKAENYTKSFYEYMKTVGAFYFPNIFVIYDELINEIVEDVLDEQLNFCVKQLDNFVTEIYKEEVFNLK
jgi:hypothetical protein